MKIVRYFFVGGAAAIVDIGLFTLFVEVFGFNYFAVGAATFILATFVNYLLSVKMVFQSGARFSRRHEVGLVFAVSGVGLVVNQAVLFIGVSIFQLPPLAAKLTATGLVFFWNYWARAHFVFRRPTAH